MRYAQCSIRTYMHTNVHLNGLIQFKCLFGCSIGLSARHTHAHTLAHLNFSICYMYSGEMMCSTYMVCTIDAGETLLLWISLFSSSFCCCCCCSPSFFTLTRCRNWYARPVKWRVEKSSFLFDFQLCLNTRGSKRLSKHLFMLQPLRLACSMCSLRFYYWHLFGIY